MLAYETSCRNSGERHKSAEATQSGPERHELSARSHRLDRPAVAAPELSVEAVDVWIDEDGRVHHTNVRRHQGDRPQ